jgi:hypothetical protein
MRTYSGRYLDNLGATANGATVAQWQSSASNNQRWQATNKWALADRESALAWAKLVPDATMREGMLEQIAIDGEFSSPGDRRIRRDCDGGWKNQG